MKYEDAVDHLCLMRTGGLVDAEVVDAIVDTHAQIANDALVHQLVRDAEQNLGRALNRVSELEARVVILEAALVPECTSEKLEELGIDPERSLGPCGYRFHADDCTCGGMGGDR